MAIKSLAFKLYLSESTVLWARWCNTRHLADSIVGLFVRESLNQTDGDHSSILEANVSQGRQSSWMEMSVMLCYWKKICQPHLLRSRFTCNCLRLQTYVLQCIRQTDQMRESLEIFIDFDSWVQDSDATCRSLGKLKENYSLLQLFIFLLLLFTVLSKVIDEMLNIDSLG